MDERWLLAASDASRNPMLLGWQRWMLARLALRAWRFALYAPRRGVILERDKVSKVQSVQHFLFYKLCSDWLWPVFQTDPFCVPNPSTGVGLHFGEDILEKQTTDLTKQISVNLLEHQAVPGKLNPGRKLDTCTLEHLCR